MKKISIIGTGYVGLVTGVCLSSLGNNIICVDTDTDKINKLNKGIIPIYEPGLEELIINNRDRLEFTTDIKKAIEESYMVFICVGTPSGEDGSADLQYVLDAAKCIGQYMINDLFVIDKSTVPVGTGEKVKSEIYNQLKDRNLNIKVNIVSNPEFLKEGSAIEDFIRPDRIIIGIDNDNSKEALFNLYYPLVRNDENKIIFMDIKSAELTKYAANSLLATKISFINEMAKICELVGADINNIRRGIGTDSRIGNKFLYAGCGYGGSCFPKDIKAIIQTSESYGYTPKIITATEEVNNNQKLVVIDKALNYYNNEIKGKTFAIWGLAFKPNTDDMREAPSIYTINELLNRGAIVKVYDPQVVKEIATKHYLKDNSNLIWCGKKEDTIIDSNGLLILTEWKEFQNPNFNLFDKLKDKLIIDGRNIYNKYDMKKYKYFQIGVVNNLEEK